MNHQRPPLDKVDVVFFIIGWWITCIGITMQFKLPGFLVYFGASLMALIWSSKR
jgi:hypothetical protein